MYLSTLPAGCAVNFQASWFIACDGKRVFLSSGTPRDAFELLDQRAYQPSGYKLRVNKFCESPRSNRNDMFYSYECVEFSGRWSNEKDFP